jgi:hypothetical protein
MRNVIIISILAIASWVAGDLPAAANLWTIYPPPSIPSTCKYPLYGPYSTRTLRDSWAKTVFPRTTWSGNYLTKPPKDPIGYPGYWCGYFGVGYYFWPGA